MFKKNVAFCTLLSSLLLSACSANGAADAIPSTSTSLSTASTSVAPASTASSDATVTTESWRRSRRRNRTRGASPEPNTPDATETSAASGTPAPSASSTPDASASPSGLASPAGNSPAVPTATPAVPLTPVVPVSGGSWTPAVSDTWQWQLQGTVDTSYNAAVYDIDLFDTPQSTILALKSQGRHAVCYFSAGSSENWRPDFAQLQSPALGSALSGWPGERWLDTRSENVRAVMQSRMAMAKAKGCDGVEPDNVDGYTNNPGFPLTSATQLDYNRFLANAAHAAGLRVALKNDVDQVSQLASSFDFAINEQCNQYSECGAYSAFTNAGKPVFNAEYASKYTDAGTRASLCANSKAANIRTIVLPESLNNAYRYSCD